MQDSMIQSALSQLQEMQPASLSGQDRHLRDLLIVKAADKGYITHSSDSLILDVVNYFSHHKNSRFYPEALYYAGRVYSDLGDFPTALRYYQDALDALPGNTSNLQLKGNITSQTARLLNKLGLYSQAIPYLKDVIKLDESQKDTFGLVYDNQLLGALYLHQEKYDSADNYFSVAYRFASHLPSEHQDAVKIYKAAVRYYTDSISEALNIIRTLRHSNLYSVRNMTLGYASNIYLKAGIYDTAYIFARELALSKNPKNRKNGYSILLDPKLRHIIPEDSVEYFFADYKDVLETHFKKNESNATLIQNSLYNYSLHERQREKAEKKTYELNVWILCLTIILLVLLLLVVYLKNKSNKRLIDLHATLDKLQFLQETLEKDNGSKPKLVLNVLTTGRQALIEEINNKLNGLQDLSRHIVVSDKIIESEAYRQLIQLIESDKPIPEKSPLWNEIEETVSESHPEFKKRLRMLAGNLKEEDFRLALLMKCGMSATRLSTLMSKAKSTITYRKEGLSKRLMGDKFDFKTIDTIIRIL